MCSKAPARSKAPWRYGAPCRHGLVFLAVTVALGGGTWFMTGDHIRMLAALVALRHARDLVCGRLIMAWARQPGAAC